VSELEMDDKNAMVQGFCLHQGACPSLYACHQHFSWRPLFAVV